MSTTLINVAKVFVGTILLFTALVTAEAAAEKLFKTWRRRRENRKTDAKTAD